MIELDALNADKGDRANKAQVRQELEQILAKEVQKESKVRLSNIKDMKQKINVKDQEHNEIMLKKQKIQAYYDRGNEYMVDLEMNNNGKGEEIRILQLEEPNREELPAFDRLQKKHWVDDLKQLNQEQLNMNLQRDQKRIDDLKQNLSRTQNQH